MVLFTSILISLQSTCNSVIPQLNDLSMLTSSACNQDLIHYIMYRCIIHSSVISQYICTSVVVYFMRSSIYIVLLRIICNLVRYCVVPLWRYTLDQYMTSCEDVLVPHWQCGNSTYEPCSKKIKVLCFIIMCLSNENHLLLRVNADM